MREFRDWWTRHTGGRNPWPASWGKRKQADAEAELAAQIVAVGSWGIAEGICVAAMEGMDAMPATAKYITTLLERQGGAAREHRRNVLTKGPLYNVYRDPPNAAEQKRIDDHRREVAQREAAANA
jgi:hypothetical protein